MLRAADEYYGGHRIGAAPGTHSQIADYVCKYVQKSAHILDLGAYTGALISRLRNEGYTKLAGADLSNHLTEEVDQFCTCDFNKEFASLFARKKFDCITTSEVIEHLDNPRNFLLQCRSLLNEGGILIVSTPNIQFFEGRIKFALTGELWGFGAKNYRSIRHITPIAATHFPMMMEESGFECKEVSTGASYASSLRKIITAPIWLPMRALMGKRVLGETLFGVGIANKDSTTTTSHGSEPWVEAAE